MEVQALEDVLQQSFQTLTHRERPSMLIPMAAELLKLGSDPAGMSPVPILDLITQLLKFAGTEPSIDAALTPGLALMVREVSEPQPEIFEKLIDTTPDNLLPLSVTSDDPHELYLAFESLVGGHAMATPLAFLIYALARLWDTFDIKPALLTEAAAVIDTVVKKKKPNPSTRRGKTKALNTELEADQSRPPLGKGERAQEVICSLIDLLDELLMTPLVVMQQPLLQLQLYLPRVLNTLSLLSANPPSKMPDIESIEAKLAHKTLRKFGEALFHCATCLSIPHTDEGTEASHTLGTALAETPNLASIITRIGDYTVQGSILEAVLVIYEAALKPALGRADDTDAYQVSNVNENESALVVASVNATAQSLNLSTLSEVLSLLPHAAVRCWINWLSNHIEQRQAEQSIVTNPRRLRQSKTDRKMNDARTLLANSLMEFLNAGTEGKDRIDASEILEGDRVLTRARSVLDQLDTTTRNVADAIPHTALDERMERVRTLLTALNTTQRSRVRQITVTRAWFTKNTEAKVPRTYASSVSSLVANVALESTRGAMPSYELPRYPSAFTPVAYSKLRSTSLRLEDVAEDELVMLASPEPHPIQLQIGASGSMVFFGGGGHLSRMYGVALPEFLDSVFTDVVSLDARGSVYATTGILTLVGKCAFMPDEDRGMRLKTPEEIIMDVRTLEEKAILSGNLVANEVNRSLRLLFPSVETMEACLEILKEVVGTSPKHPEIALYRGDPQTISSDSDDDTDRRRNSHLGLSQMELSQPFRQVSSVEQTASPPKSVRRSELLNRSPHLSMLDTSMDAGTAHAPREFHDAFSQIEFSQAPQTVRRKQRRKLSHATMEKFVGLDVDELARAIEETIDMFAGDDETLALNPRAPATEPTSTSSHPEPREMKRGASKKADARRVLEAIEAADSARGAESQDADNETESNAGDEDVDLDETASPPKSGKSLRGRKEKATTPSPPSRSGRRLSKRQQASAAATPTSSTPTGPTAQPETTTSDRDEEIPDHEMQQSATTEAMTPIPGRRRGQKWSTTSPAAVGAGPRTPLSDTALQSPLTQPEMRRKPPTATATATATASTLRSLVPPSGATPVVPTTVSGSLVDPNITVRSKRRMSGSAQSGTTSVSEHPQHQQQQQQQQQDTQGHNRPDSNEQAKTTRATSQKKTTTIPRIPLGRLIGDPNQVAAAVRTRQLAMESLGQEESDVQQVITDGAISPRRANEAISSSDAESEPPTTSRNHRRNLRDQHNITPSRSAPKPVFARVPRLRYSHEGSNGEESGVSSSEDTRSADDALGVTPVTPARSGYDEASDQSFTTPTSEDTSYLGLGRRRGRTLHPLDDESPSRSDTSTSPPQTTKRLRRGQRGLGTEVDASSRKLTSLDTEETDLVENRSGIEAMFQQVSSKKKDLLKRWAQRVERNLDEGITSLLDNARFELKSMNEQMAQVMGIGILEEATRIAETGVASLVSNQQVMRRTTADMHELVARATETIRKQAQQLVDSQEEIQRIHRRSIKHLTQTLREQREELLNQIRSD